MPIDGTLDYIELPGADIPATKLFYKTVFGWRFTDYGPDYAAFEACGRDGGFNAERKVLAGGGPLIVLYANDLEAMEAKVVAASTSAILTAMNWRCGPNAKPKVTGSRQSALGKLKTAQELGVALD
ncbi:MAG: hypothetical protein P4L57_03190 [Rhizomicrobium sp.]|nr:hypothetical protein [Rhizomicrobium sp.]